MFSFDLSVCLLISARLLCMDEPSPAIFPTEDRCNFIAAIEAGQRLAQYRYPVAFRWTCQEEPNGRTLGSEGAINGVFDLD